MDEVGELPLEMQPKLLRAIENRSFRRVGGRSPVQVDVRIVAATSRRLRQAMRRGEFREDLFYRLAVVHVRVPALSDRPEDVAPLAELFLRRALRSNTATLPPELASLLASYGWPGNARELRNVIDRFATFGQADPRVLFGETAAEPTPSPALLDPARLAALSYHEAKRELVDAFHRAVLPRVLAAAGGSILLAAERLGIPRTSLYRMLKNVSGGDDAEED